MNVSSLARSQLEAPLRALALTVEESAPGDFHWCIVENSGSGQFELLQRSGMSFAAYDTALATGYGELQRLIGPDLQYGPRRDPATWDGDGNKGALASPAVAFCDLACPTAASAHNRREACQPTFKLNSVGSNTGGFPT